MFGGTRVANPGFSTVTRSRPPCYSYFPRRKMFFFINSYPGVEMKLFGSAQHPGGIRIENKTCETELFLLWHCAWGNGKKGSSSCASGANQLSCSCIWPVAKKLHRHSKHHTLVEVCIKVSQDSHFYSIFVSPAVSYLRSDHLGNNNKSWRT